MINWNLLAIATSLLMSVSAHASVTLVIEEGTVMGAENVAIGDDFYTASFVDGTCLGLFDRCSEKSFDFGDAESSLGAVSALIDQVLVDLQPGQIFGCVDSLSCFISSPFSRDSNSHFSFAYSGVRDESYFVDTASRWVGSNTSNSSSQVYVAFELQPGSFAESIDVSRFAAPNPEPGTWMMMLAGFAVVGSALQRRRKSSLVGVSVRG